MKIHTAYSMVTAVAACALVLHAAWAGEEGRGKPGQVRPWPGERPAKFRGEEAGREGLAKDGRPVGSLLDHVLGNPKIVEELALSQEQIAALKTASEDLKRVQDELASRQDEEGVIQARLLMGSEDVDEEQIMQAVERAGKARIEMAKARVKQLLVVRKTLTPEQMEKIREMIRQKIAARVSDERSARWRDRMEEWRKHRAGSEEVPGRKCADRGAEQKDRE